MMSFLSDPVQNRKKGAIFSLPPGLLFILSWQCIADTNAEMSCRHTCVSSELKF